ncbi:Gag-Pol polyprotein [Gossypium australe]|uniref:Gag-Pol polyprotein n=1 Tax=Gossypium australe TaxID=47621 RepID=A0A5B6WRJ2_9ROSI|nr:Gag-Pol polyprotein [Gossypium australe]
MLKVCYFSVERLCISMVEYHGVCSAERVSDLGILSDGVPQEIYKSAIMCKRFVDGLNEDIKLLVGILDLKEFLVLVERACKVEDFS